MSDFERWMDGQYRYSAQAMLRSVSPVDLVKDRPGFGQRIAARRGAIVASPVLGSYDPDPDYFFHWYRDSAVVIEALRMLAVDGSVSRERAQTLFAEFVDFNLALRGLDGRERVRDSSWRNPVRDDFQRYVRDDADLGAVYGDRVAAETRVNPDATLDISRWARPQHDGPPLRALALLRWLSVFPLDDALRRRVDTLIEADIAFATEHWREPSFDIWEEESGSHYYTLRVCAAALHEGADWLRDRGDDAAAQRAQAEAQTILATLDGFWSPSAKHFDSRRLASGEPPAKALDIAIILSAIHSDDGSTTPDAHGVGDARQQATLAALEALFARDYAINRSRPQERGVAMGRYHGDVYYSGGAYYFSTLGAAEFCYRAARRAATPQHWIARGDGFLEAVRAHTPQSGELSEQFDQNSGAQTSARHLAWSYAALISAVNARRTVTGT
jgi:glucoamylase